MSSARPAEPIADREEHAPGDHIVAQLGLRTATEGAVIRGQATVWPEICAPGTEYLRTSVLATWADIMTGWVAGTAINPRVPLTLDLEVQLHRGARRGDRLTAEAVAVKVGRTVVVCETRFRDEDSGGLVAVAYVSFVASPDPRHLFPDGFPDLGHLGGRLTEPLADRVGARTVAPGTVEMPRRLDGLNSGGAIQGGLVAFAAEEAACSLAERPAVLAALTVRYLRPALIGPARAVAERHGDLVLANITDAGSGKLCAIASGRFADGPSSGR